MYSDFVRAFEQLQEDFKTNEQKRCSAAERLDWEEENIEDIYPEDSPSPPPPVEFIFAR